MTNETAQLIFHKGRRYYVERHVLLFGKVYWIAHDANGAPIKQTSAETRSEAIDKLRTNVGRCLDDQGKHLHGGTCWRGIGRCCG